MTAWLEHAWLARYLDRELEGRSVMVRGIRHGQAELLAKIEADTGLRDA
jgi:hypothetical protein